MSATSELFSRLTRAFRQHGRADKNTFFGCDESGTVCRRRCTTGLARADAQEATRHPLHVRSEILAAEVRHPEWHYAACAEYALGGGTGPSRFPLRIHDRRRPMFDCDSGRRPVCRSHLRRDRLDIRTATE